MNSSLAILMDNWFCTWGFSDDDIGWIEGRGTVL